MLGFQAVGNDGRQGRQMAKKWLRLHSVRSAPAPTCDRSGRGQQIAVRSTFSNAAVQTPDASCHGHLEDADEGVAEAR